MARTAVTRAQTAGLEQPVEGLGEVPKPHVGRDAGEQQMHVAPPPAQQDRRRDGERQRSAKEHRAVSKIQAGSSLPFSGPEARVATSMAANAAGSASPILRAMGAALG